MRLTNYLRADHWWEAKAAGLLGYAYWLTLANGLTFAQAAPALGASLITIAGIAGFGYFLNDFADIETDAAAGKRNFVARLSAVQRLVLALGLLSLAGLPWLYLPLNAYNGALFFVQLGLFAAYSLPPVRLKERGYLGVMADALYAHGLPTVMAGITYYLIGGEQAENYTAFLAATFVWQFAEGNRNVIDHQISDRHNDQRAQTHTFVTQTSAGFALKLTHFVWIPLELAGFGWLIYQNFQTLPLLLGLYAGFVLYKTILWTQVWDNPLRPARQRGLSFMYLNNFYEEWLPAFFLVVLALKEPLFWIYLPIHTLLFPKTIRRLLVEFGQIGRYLSVRYQRAKYAIWLALKSEKGA